MHRSSDFNSHSMRNHDGLILVMDASTAHLSLDDARKLGGHSGKVDVTLIGFGKQRTFTCSKFDAEAMTEAVKKADPKAFQFARVFTEFPASVDKVHDEVSTSLVIEHHEFGWWIYVSDPEDIEGAGCPSLIPVMEKAARLGARWVKFDCDAMKHADLPEHEW